MLDDFTIIFPDASVVTVVAPLPLILFDDVTFEFSTLFIYTFPFVNAVVVFVVEVAEPTTFFEE